jgi:ureidoglycolate lyase
VVVVQPLTIEAFEPFGEVLGTRRSDDRESAIEAWTQVARERYGGEVAARSLSLPARPAELGFIEAHPNSPQLSVAFDSPWLLTVVPGIPPGTEVGRLADVSSARSFLVPAEMGVVLRAGLWHGPVTSLGDTAALVVFRAGVVDEWTELDNPVALALPPAS